MPFRNPTSTLKRKINSLPPFCPILDSLIPKRIKYLTNKRKLKIRAFKSIYDFMGFLFFFKNFLFFLKSGCTIPFFAFWNTPRPPLFWPGSHIMGLILKDN